MLMIRKYHYSNIIDSNTLTLLVLIFANMLAMAYWQDDVSGINRLLQSGEGAPYREAILEGGLSAFLSLSHYFIIICLFVSLVIALLRTLCSRTCLSIDEKHLRLERSFLGKKTLIHALELQGGERLIVERLAPSSPLIAASGAPFDKAYFKSSYVFLLGSENQRLYLYHALRERNAQQWAQQLMLDHPQLQVQEHAELCVEPYPQLESPQPRAICFCRKIAFRWIMLVIMLLSGLIATLASYRYHHPEEGEYATPFMLELNPEVKHKDIHITSIYEGGRETKVYSVGPDYDTSQLSHTESIPKKYLIYPLWVDKSATDDYPDLFSATPYGSVDTLRLSLGAAFITLCAALAFLLSYLYRRPKKISSADWVIASDSSGSSIIISIPLVYNVLRYASFDSIFHSISTALWLMMVICAVAWMLYDVYLRCEYSFAPQGLVIRKQLFNMTLSTREIPAQEGDSILLTPLNREEARPYLHSFKSIFNQDEIYHTVFLCRADGERVHLYHSEQVEESRLFVQEWQKKYATHCA